MNRLVLFVALISLSGCANPMNLTYDFGRSYTASVQAQSDLSRPSVAAAQYRLSGMEGTEIRLRLYETTTEASSEEIQFDMAVQ